MKEFQVNQTNPPIPTLPPMNNEMGGQDDKAAEDDEDVDKDPAAGSEGEDHNEDEGA